MEHERWVWVDCYGELGLGCQEIGGCPPAFGHWFKVGEGTLMASSRLCYFLSLPQQLWVFRSLVYGFEVILHFPEMCPCTVCRWWLS
jgi:hypothetical protein